MACSYDCARDKEDKDKDIHIVETKVSHWSLNYQHIYCRNKYITVFDHRSVQILPCIIMEHLGEDFLIVLSDLYSLKCSHPRTPAQTLLFEPETMRTNIFHYMLLMIIHF